MDCSPPGSSVHGIFQAWILEWVAVSFSRGSSWPRDRTRVSRIVGRRFTVWATREAHQKHRSPKNKSQIPKERYKRQNNRSGLKSKLTLKKFASLEVERKGKWKLIIKVLIFSFRVKGNFVPSLLLLRFEEGEGLEQRIREQEIQKCFGWFWWDTRYIPTRRWDESCLASLWKKKEKN